MLLTKRTFTPGENTINSSDIHKYFNGLEFDIDCLTREDDPNYIEELTEEYNTYKEIISTLEGYNSSSRSGTELIEEKHFPAWAQDYLTEIGIDIPDILQGNIDWEGVATDIQQDFASVEIEAFTYWFRCE